MNVYYTCKYTPLELIEACGAKPRPLVFETARFESADAKICPNLCGYAKSLIEFVLTGEVEALVLTTCCDAMRRSFDVLQKEQKRGTSKLRFLYLLDLPHGSDALSQKRYASEMQAFQNALEAATKHSFDKATFMLAWERACQQAPLTPARRAKPSKMCAPVLLGAHAMPSLVEQARSLFPDGIQNMTCSGARVLEGPSRELLREMPTHLSASCKKQCFAQNASSATGKTISPDKSSAKDPIFSQDKTQDEKEQPNRLLRAYAGTLLKQAPCVRMTSCKNHSEALAQAVKEALGIIFHTMKFCDFYGFEYTDLKKSEKTPMVKIETEGTPQSAGQLKTRLQAFAETLNVPRDLAVHKRRKKPQEKEKAAQKVSQNASQEITKEPSSKDSKTGSLYVLGIDSGSTSTDAVVLDHNKEILARIIMPTGANARASAAVALQEALACAGLTQSDISLIVATGYGRAAIEEADLAITEITCHAKGAHYLAPQTRTIIDIGGQDSKVIKIDERGNVETFVMNDKCAAGTGRFLEALARTMEMDLEDFVSLGVAKKDRKARRKGPSTAVSISSMCTVFAESEVISLIADGVSAKDIVRALNKSVAEKTVSLAKRTKPEASYLMTGGVAKNKGVVQALEEALDAEITTPDEAQLAGALGAALLGFESLEGVNP